MADQHEEPAVADDSRDAPSREYHEVLRCRRGDETRSYNLRVVAGGAELWRFTELPGAERQSVKECDFTDSEQASRFLEEVRRSLTAGGWKPAGHEE